VVLFDVQALLIEIYTRARVSNNRLFTDGSSNNFFSCSFDAGPDSL